MLQQDDDAEGQQAASRLRVRVRNSRLLFGIADAQTDPAAQLRPGQCFLRPTIDGIPQIIAAKRVLVVHPCLPTHAAPLTFNPAKHLKENWHLHFL